MAGMTAGTRKVNFYMRKEIADVSKVYIQNRIYNVMTNLTSYDLYRKESLIGLRQGASG